MSGTSLAEQLKKLAAPQTSIFAHSKKKASLLFDPKDAADINRETLFKIGLSGLEELISIDSRLGHFAKSLFDETSLHLERAVEDQQANAKLNQMINRFLILISPYLNLKASHKALEWLICRFHIHEYNTDSILAVFLPYHDTNIFARMVQILPVQGGRWLWLQPLKKEGIPMSKLFLLSRASSDTSFFKFVCNLPLQGIQVHGDKSVCLTTLFAFYCTTVIGALDQAPQVTEVHITHLLPSLMAGLGSSHVDFAASAFMILGHLVTKVRLTPPIFSELFYKVCKSEVECLRKEAVLVLVVMTQVGRPPSVLPAVRHLASCSWLLPTLSHLVSAGVVVFPLVAAVLTDSLAALADTTQQDLLQTFIKEILEQLPFNKDEAIKLLKLFAETSLPKDNWYHAILHQLEKAHPDAFDDVVKSHPKLLGLIPGFTARNDLFHRLNHPQPHIRLKAVLHIQSQDELLKEEWVKEELLDKLEDESTRVVSAVLSVGLPLPPQKLRAVVARCWHGPVSSHNLVAPCLRRLPSDTQLILLALPFLLPTDAAAVPNTKKILKCKSVRKCLLLKPLCDRLLGNMAGQNEDTEASDQERQDEKTQVTEKGLSKAVFRFILKDLKGLSIASVLEAGSQLKSYGCVYQLMSLLVAAGTLAEQTTPDDMAPLFHSLMDYNASPNIHAEVHDELKAKNLAKIVSVCRKGKLPFQGSLFVLSLIMKKLKSPVLDGKCIFDVREPDVALLVDFFKLVFQMKNSNSTYIQKSYSNFCNEMLEKCCETPEARIDLLCNMSLGCPAISGECITRVAELVHDLSCVRERVLVPAMLVALGAKQDEARRSAVSLLRSLTQQLATPTYHKLLTHLSEYWQEMDLDHEQVNVALYMCLSPDPSVQSLLDKSVRQDFASTLNTLLDMVVSPQTPDYVVSPLLQTLDQINSQGVLERLLPLGLKIIFSEQISPDELNVLHAVIKRISVCTAGMFKENYIWTFVEACLSPKSRPSVTTLLMQQIDKDLFAALSVSDQQRLLALVVSCSAHTEHGDVTSAAASCVKRLVLDTAVVAALLLPMRDFTIETPSQSTKKRAWVGKKPPPLELLTSKPWKEGLCLLELIQNKKKLENVHILIPTLFEILNRCLLFEEQSPVEYTKQVLLTSLLHCCSKLTADHNLSPASVQVELVVECIRASQNPQTHHHALLLLAHIATMFPERVLYSIMPVFTFMGSSLLRQDDAYSFQIISKIIETIIPVLLKGESEQELTVEMVGVLRVFAEAVLDIPEHRRFPLFTKLLDTLDQGRFLWAFLALVCESHILHPGPPQAAAGSAVKEPGSIPERLDVGLRLCHQFSVSTVLSAACHLIRYLCSLPTDKGDKSLEAFKKKSEASLFDIELASDKQFRHYRHTVLTFLSMLLSSKQFLNHMAKLSMEEVLDLKDIFQQMFEGILTFTQFVSKQVDLNVGQLLGKYWNSMYNICFDVMAKTNALLPGDMFLGVVASLLDHELAIVGCKALELLNWRLQQAQRLDSTLLLGLLPRLLALVKDKRAAPLTQQTALLAVKFIARDLAADHPDNFQEVFKATTKLVKKRDMQDPVLASAMLCLGELCHTLGAYSIVSLPTFMPAVLDVLEKLKPVGTSSGDLLLVSTVSAAHKIVDSLVGFLSPYLSRLLQHLSVLSADCGDNARLQPVLQKVKVIRQKISSTVPPRVLLPAVSESYSQLLTPPSVCPAAVPILLSILADSFKSGLELSPELSAFFLSALDFRSQGRSAQEVDIVEPAVISAIVALILKLSESLFRPFYYKIFNWALRSSDSNDRSITFYKLTCTIAESLKGLFVSFADYFLKHAATMLDNANLSKPDVEVSSQAQTQELLDAVLRALLTVFLHDASHFVTKERFDTLMQPLVDQLENSLGGEEQMGKRTNELVIPCLTQMAVSAADDTLWKQLNYQILLKTRHSQPQVRIGSVLAVCDIAKKLGEEFLPLLPETVPFLAELLEDEVESVEKTSERVVQQLEAALGEQISKYF